MGKKTSKATTRRSLPIARKLTKSVRTKLRLGDVIEFETANGFAYAQYVHKHTKAQAYGQLLRIIEGCFPIRMQVEDVLRRDTLYVCFCRPQPELQSGTARIIGNVEVPKAARSLPLFKWAFRNIITGKAIRWEIWDGKTRKGRPVAKLSELEKSYPLLEIVTLDTVITRIESNWKPEDECKPGATSVFGLRR